jgi:anti-sigma regulatory factor (Ser/Thr protein kinase)
MTSLPAQSAASPDADTGPGPLPARTYRQRPGPAKPERSLILAPVDTAPRDARATVRASLKLWGLPHLIEPAEAICSELLTNAVTVSRDKAPPGGEPCPITFRLTVEADDGELCIRVWDPDPTPPPEDQLLPGDDEEGGRGLFIVSALSDRWGWYPAPNGGKFVWSACALDTESQLG